jgi:uncharacterized repeat protein (TIGR03803 family)
MVLMTAPGRGAVEITFSPVASLPFNQGTGVTRGPDGALYGVTCDTTSISRGTVFRVDPDTGAIATIHVFGPDDGQCPNADLVLADDGRLYGTTYLPLRDELNALISFGTIFSIEPHGAQRATFHSVYSLGTSSDALANLRGVTFAADGWLYGLALSGGPLGSGGLFRVHPSGVGFEVLDGGGGNSAPLVARDGTIYWAGSTAVIGPNGGQLLAAIRRFNPAKQSSTVVYTFPAGFETLFTGALIEDANGAIWGTTQSGGDYNRGTVFRLADGTVTFVRSLDGDIWRYRWPHGTGRSGRGVGRAHLWCRLRGRRMERGHDLRDRARYLRPGRLRVCESVGLRSPQRTGSERTTHRGGPGNVLWNHDRRCRNRSRHRVQVRTDHARP